MPELIFLSALLTLIVGATVFWVNPQRTVNQVFALLSTATTLWLFFFFLALREGARYAVDPSSDPIPWLRATSSVGATFPWILWLLIESITAHGRTLRQNIAKSFPWLIFAVLLSGLCFTNYFIPADSTPENPRRGIGYLVYSASSFILYVLLLVLAYRQLRKETGVRKIEMQFLTLNCGLTCLLVIALTAAGSYSDYRFLSRLSPLVILIFYILTAWAVSVHRIFDARQVFLSVVQRLTFVLTLCFGIFFLTRALHKFIPAPFDLLISVVVFSSIAFWLQRLSSEWFGISLAQKINITRRTIIDLARSEPSPDKLVVSFETLLREWGQTSYARLMFDSGELYVSGDLEFTKNRPGHAALCKDGWSTPESLQRQRAEPGLVDLKQFLTDASLALIVTAPRGSPSPSLLIALGTKVNHRPFTYPEVQQLQDLAEFMDNILARSRLTMQARQSEQLATIGLLGASLAHEIRNPLVSIKTFAHLLPTRFDDPEFRRRFNLLIPGEVDRIDSLTQQLLDLSNPRRHQMEHISLHSTVRETVDLMLTRATEARISISSTLTAAKDTIHADASAIRQVLINLFINAIQALEHQDTDRRIEIRSRSSPNGSVILEVSDNGPGIPPEQRAKLFHPFASTKTTGMGLGLAVCSDILHEHRATIIVPETGRPGATFRITFPAPPPQVGA
ncbi:two-component system sensor histidine kinase NtrB [Oleiharenicola lentus]|uniref:two-component system sensor histidine kinase NtrB n=1 Tax=Oleiharenicola lentus TaxID=2508720 RepID=UPI003F681CD8